MSRREDGAAVVMALGLAALIVFVAVIGGGVVAVIATHRQVQGAADLAALAGASAAQEGGSPCLAAERIGRRNGVSVRLCEASDGDVTVVVERRLPGAFGSKALRARARAGPTS
ncbi:Rv3654c family TadE-like protein [Marmoricola solisilvae]|uniref:Putative Flp pilus-assembly TadG-like N-terminal domain-containing protein n=1 Tax=Nocardioides marmorisolisilvae TaxID=1542737 RepID=A0A3N0E0E6_9ACTN|nr:hypothetical protein EFL95_02595 [Nocardioides marmorisolisilvae]